MNKIFALFFLTIFFIGNAQKELTPRNLKTLNDLGIKSESKVSYEQFDQLNQILQADRKKNHNKTAGFVFTGVGVLASTMGIVMIDSSKNDQEGLGGTIGTMITVVGVAHIGASVPFFLGAKKQKKRRDAFIKEYKNIQ